MLRSLPRKNASSSSAWLRHKSLLSPCFDHAEYPPETSAAGAARFANPPPHLPLTSSRPTASDDVHAATIGEQMFGIGREVQDFIYYNAGTGIAIGIVVGGKLYKGASNTAGENGHAVLDHSRGGHGGHGDALPSFVLDLTDPLQRVAGLGGARPNAIGIQIVPVAAANGKPGTATPRRVEVVFVTS